MLSPRPFAGEWPPLQARTDSRQYVPTEEYLYGIANSKGFKRLEGWMDGCPSTCRRTMRQKSMRCCGIYAGDGRENQARGDSGCDPESGPLAGKSGGSDRTVGKHYRTRNRETCAGNQTADANFDSSGKGRGAGSSLFFAWKPYNGKPDTDETPGVNQIWILTLIQSIMKVQK